MSTAEVRAERSCRGLFMSCSSFSVSLWLEDSSRMDEVDLANARARFVRVLGVALEVEGPASECKGVLRRLSFLVFPSLNMGLSSWRALSSRLSLEDSLRIPFLLRLLLDVEVVPALPVATVEVAGESSSEELISLHWIASESGWGGVEGTTSWLLLTLGFVVLSTSESLSRLRWLEDLVLRGVLRRLRFAAWKS